jgi:hypothetical protein
MADIVHTGYIPNNYSLYWPLNQERDEIRLLRVKAEPADSRAEVLCYLTYASLQDPHVPHAYTCLSYCWGDASSTREITVVQPERCLHDGTYEGKRFRFRVTVTLESALRSVRSLTARPLIWADAVCINQSDLIERANQVSMMHEIYSMSMQTLIWLGDADNESNIAMDFAIHIRSVLARVEHLDMNSSKGGVRNNRLRGLLRGELAFTLQEAEDTEFRTLRLATRTLLRRPWFRRVWVLQEVSRSSSVVAILGSKACQWEDIRNLGVWENRITLWIGDIPWADSQQSLLATGATMMSDMERADDLPEIWYFLARECKDGRLPTIIELIFRRGQIQATDPRNQVFALFGIARECQGSFSHLDGFRPDYSKTLAQVYTDFTRAAIEATGSLDVLSAINTFQHWRQRRVDLPSWVPEFDKHFNLRRSLSFLGLQGYKTTRGLPLTMETSDDKDTLMVYGALIDTIDLPNELEDESLQVRRSARTQVRELIYDSAHIGIKHLWSWLRTQNCPSPAGQDLLEAFILTLICCRDDQRTRTIKFAVNEIPNLFAEFTAYWERIEPDFESLPPQSKLYQSRHMLKQLSSSGSAAAFGRRIMWTCDSRRLLVTKDGYMGLFPRHAAHRDRIAVLFGSNVPWVIRPFEAAAGGQPQRHQLIGECYVHGRMDGSVVNELESGVLTAQLICLR